MSTSKPKLRTFDPYRLPEPKYFTRTPDDALEDPGLPLKTQAVFTQLLKGRWDNSDLVKLTRSELADRCRISERALYAHLERLEKHGYIRRERDYGQGGAPHQIRLCFELRPALEMAPDIPIARGSSGTCNRKPASACNRKPASACNRKPASACNRKPASGPTLFEEIEKDGEKEREEFAPAPATGAEETPEPRQEPAPRPAPVPIPDPEPNPPQPSPGPPTPTREPDERATGRTGEEHALFIETWRDLRDHESTNFIARQLAMDPATPDITCLASWQLWVASRVALCANKSKELPAFKGYARNATVAEYHRFRDAEVRGALVPRGEPPRSAQPQGQKAKVWQNFDATVEYFHEQGAFAGWPVAAGIDWAGGRGVDRDLPRDAPGEAREDRLAAPGDD